MWVLPQTGVSEHLCFPQLYQPKLKIKQDLKVERVSILRHADERIKAFGIKVLLN
jgi:hypothetical protein